MREYIKKVQAKNEETRKFIFLTSMIVSMVIVGLIWYVNLDNRFSDKDIVKETREDIKPFKLFSNSVLSTYNNISASVGNISKDKIDVSSQKQIDLIPVEEN